MHHSRLCALLIDCNTPDVDQAASFWAEPALPGYSDPRGGTAGSAGGALSTTMLALAMNEGAGA